MQGRVSFNAGEFAPELGVRADIDYYNRGCLTMENWDVSQLGGVRRRKGMRKFADALSADSVLIPYVYSYEDRDDNRFLVEVCKNVVRVLSLDGKEQARFTSDENVFFPFEFEREDCRFKQVNAMLFLTSLKNPPLVLKYDGKGEWKLELFEFKERPWRYNHEEQDYSVKVERDGASINVVFPDEAKEEERPEGLLTTDWLRLSYWVEQQEAESKSEELREGVTVVTEVPDIAAVGDKFAINTDNTVKYWVCASKWTKSENYVEGMDSPANYPNQFVAVENTAGYDEVTPVYSILGVGDTIEKGIQSFTTTDWTVHDAEPILLIFLRIHKGFYLVIPKLSAKGLQNTVYHDFSLKSVCGSSPRQPFFSFFDTVFRAFKFGSFKIGFVSAVAPRLNDVGFGNQTKRTFLAA